ncbi:phosphatase PAP2 family protein [Streptomyces xiamenensis]
MARSLLTAAVSGVLFVLLTVAVLVHGREPFGIDTALTNWCVEHRSSGLTQVLRAITDSGTGVVPILLMALAGALAARRSGGIAVGALAGVGALVVGQLLRYGLVRAIDRPRPPSVDWVVHAASPSFPSGHTTTSALAGFTLCMVLLLTVRRSAARTAAVALLLCWTVAVGVSRVYLGVHWATDVLGGWLLAGFLVFLVLPAVPTLAPKRLPLPV